MAALPGQMHGEKPLIEPVEYRSLKDIEAETGNKINDLQLRLHPSIISYVKSAIQ